MSSPEEVHVHLLSDLPVELKALLAAAMGHPKARAKSSLEAAIEECSQCALERINDPHVSIFDALAAIVEGDARILKHMKRAGADDPFAHASSCWMLENANEVVQLWVAQAKETAQEQELDYTNLLAGCSYTIAKVLIEEINSSMLDLRQLFMRLGSLRGLALVHQVLTVKKAQQEMSVRQKIQQEEKLWECYLYLDGLEVGRKKTDSYLDAERYGKRFFDAAKEAGQPEPTVKIVREGDDPRN